jgi:hypothetical protein
MALVAVASAGYAQEIPSVSPHTIPAPGRSSIGEPVVNRSVVDETAGYFWDFNLFHRVGSDGDTNRTDLTVPQDFGDGVEFRGFGQAFNPKVLYTFFSNVYTDNSTYVSSFYTDIASDKDYIDQFKGATSYTVDTVTIPLFKNPNPGAGSPTNPGLLSFYKTSFNFAGSAYKTNGFNVGRHSLPVLQEFEMDQTALDSTIDLENSTVKSTVIGFDPVLEFGASESMIMLYVNEFAPVVEQPVGGENDTREWQRVIANEAFRTGGFEPDPNDNTQTIDTRANPLEDYKTLGLVMYRQQGKDSIISAWRGLQFTNSAGVSRPGRLNLGIRIFGTVTLSNGVKFHYGKDATSQGVGSVSPNPVHETARIPFSLTERADVKLDLYTAGGEHVKSLVDTRYVPGNYSIDLSTEGLASGTYLVRMTAGDKAYSTKINVVK